LHADARTGEPLGDQRVHTFDSHAGGLTPADSIRGSNRWSWRVRDETVQVLRGLACNNGMSEPAEDEATHRANRLLCAYARAILDRQLPTMAHILRGRV
jgi:hypothetical protein